MPAPTPLNMNAVKRQGSVRPIVVSSRIAKDELNNIRSSHANILQGMVGQAQRSQMNREQKAAALQSQQTMKMEMDKNNMAANTDAQKVHNDFSIAQGELDIKRAALSLK